MTARWRTVTVDDRDLLPAPGDDEEMFNEIQERLNRHKLGQDWKPAGKIVNILLSTIDNKSGRCPANYVQNLVFDFRLLRYSKDDIQDYCEPIEGDYEEDEEILSLSPHDLLPTVESLKHTFTKKLEGHFHNLRHLSCHGDTPQSMLDFVACQDAAKIRSLEIRTLGAFGRLRIDFQDEPPFQRYPLRRWPLRLEELSKLLQLRTLDIHHLSNHETARLLAALPKLIELRCLILACEAEEQRDHYGGCALKSLFDQIFQHRDTVSINNDSVAGSLGWFPPNLKSLSLIDTHYNNYSNSVTMPFTQPPRLNSYLTHLCVDVGSADWIPMVVDCFSEAMVQVLSVPGCSLDSDISVRGDHAYIDHTITTHKDSLNTFRLIRAWQMDRRWIDELNDRWEETYVIQELVLGTRNPQWYRGLIRQWRKLIPKPTLSHYLCGFAYDTSGESGPTVPAKPDKLRAPATPDKSKNSKSGKKPRRKLPRSKSKLGKRIPEDDCEEWDNTAPAMKDNSGAPDVEEDNPGHFGVSGKWKYTDSKHPGAPMNAETLNILTGKQAKNQEEHWAQIKNEMKTHGTDPPWKDNEPPANSFQAEKEEGKDYWILRGASNHVLMPGRNWDDNPPKTPNQLTTLYQDTKASRAYHQNNPLHAEEVNAAQREHEGQKPFEGTLNSAHETRVGEDNRPLPACGKCCAKQIKAGGGTDANPDAKPNTPYQEKERAQQATRKRAKMAKMAPQGSDDDYTPGSSSAWGRRSLETSFDMSETDDYRGRYDYMEVHRWMLSPRSMPMQF
ncbi:hypothetical protein MMC11_002264 [Xylographa trunciseda]|nr:hypothetical protein [Xylographa trunciseda]